MAKPVRCERFDTELFLRAGGGGGGGGENAPLDTLGVVEYDELQESIPEMESASEVRDWLFATTAHVVGTLPSPRPPLMAGFGNRGVGPEGRGYEDEC